MCQPFGKLLRKYRCQSSLASRRQRDHNCSGITQQQLATMSGVHRITISRHESGLDGEPKAKTVFALASALSLKGQDLEDFYTAAHLPLPLPGTDGNESAAFLESLFRRIMLLTIAKKEEEQEIIQELEDFVSDLEREYVT